MKQANKKMFITDNTGKKIKITDMQSAEKHLRYFIQLLADQTSFYISTEEKTYWEDLYIALLEIK